MMAEVTKNLLNKDQQNILTYIKNHLYSDLNRPCQVLIQGVAGTGKSFLLEHIKTLIRGENSNCIIGSHQAIAASIIGGNTLYKIFGFSGSRDQARVEKGRKKYILDRVGTSFKISKEFSNRYINAFKNFHEIANKNWLIIDEISMIGLEFLDDMDHVLQELFSSDLAFGGINLIFSGHFSQLGPVKEVPVFKLTTDHFIKHMRLFELTINQRQKNQTHFDLCNAVMNGRLTSEQKKLLRSRLVENFDYSKIINIVHIFPTKKLCNSHNIDRLLALDEPVYYFLKSLDIGNDNVLSAEEKNVFNGLQKFIPFCKGSKIMITVNEDPFINGELYIIEDIKINNQITEKEFFKGFSYEEQNNIRNIKEKILQKKKEIIYLTPGLIQIILSKNIKLSKHKKIDDKNIDDKNIDDKNIDDKKIDDKNIDDKNINDKKIDDKNINDKKIDDKKIDDKNIDDKKIDDDKNIDKDTLENINDTIEIKSNNNINDYNDIDTKRKLNSEEIKIERILPTVTKKIEVIVKSKDEKDEKNESREIVFERQIQPFQLSWAVTTHKIQGISLEEGVIDMGESNFDHAQLYVNISRIKSFDKLFIIVLKTPLKGSPYKKIIKAFIEQIKKNNINNTVFQPNNKLDLVESLNPDIF